MRNGMPPVRGHVSGNDYRTGPLVEPGAAGGPANIHHLRGFTCTSHRLDDCMKPEPMTFMA